VGVHGLVFRTQEGRAIAKLSSDAKGGVFELLDATEQPRTRFHAAGLEPPRPSRSMPH
jgi:hypothetical protein